MLSSPSYPQVLGFFASFTSLCSPLQQINEIWAWKRSHRTPASDRLADSVHNLCFKDSFSGRYQSQNHHSHGPAWLSSISSVSFNLAHWLNGSWLLARSRWALQIQHGSTQQQGLAYSHWAPTSTQRPYLWHGDSSSQPQVLLSSGENLVEKCLTENNVSSFGSVCSGYVKVPSSQKTAERVVTSDLSDPWILEQIVLKYHQYCHPPPLFPFSPPQDGSRIPWPCWDSRAHCEQVLCCSYPKDPAFSSGHSLFRPSLPTFHQQWHTCGRC